MDDLKDEVLKIPACNMLKFSLDLQKLIQLAQKDDYEKFEI